MNGGVLARVRGWWNRVVASPAFQARAAGFWLTRPIALRRSRAVFDLTAGFVYAQTVLALVRLEVLTLLLDGPLTEADLARRTRIPESRFGRLVDASAALDLLVRRPGGWIELGALGAPLAGNPALSALVEHNAILYRDLVDPVAFLRGEVDAEVAAYWPYTTAEAPAALGPDAVAAYSDLMARSQPALAGEVMNAYDFGSHERLLDVGGGSGVFLTEVGARFPALRRELLDLPGVAEHSRRRFDEAGQDVGVHGADFLRDPLPGGFDLVTLVRIVHDHDDPEVALLLKRIHDEVLRPGGTLLVAEPMSGVPGSGRVGPAYFSFYLLAMGQGRPRTPRQLQDLLEGAGFDRIRRLKARSPVLATVTIARRS